MTSTFVEQHNPDIGSVADYVTGRCSQLNLTENKPWDTANSKLFFHNFIVLDRFKAIYCNVPKAGTTTWKVLIANASGFRHEDFRHLDQAGRPEVWIHDAINAKYPRLGYFSEKEIKYKLKNYFKFTVVRNPFDRLLSTYIDKFYRVENEGTPQTPPYINYAGKIKEHAKLKNNRTNSHKLEFRDFISYISHFVDKRDEHWESYYNLCHPCAIKFDFVGKIENMHEDKYDILDGLNLTQMKLPVKHKVEHKSYRHYYRNISDEVFVALKKAYDLDFNLFGY